MARVRHENNPLIELSDLDAEPSFVPATHVCRDDARSDFLIEVSIRPFDADRPGSGPGANEPLSDNSIQIEAQSGLQTSTLTWARHSIVSCAAGGARLGGEGLAGLAGLGIPGYFS
jgi:hypothetical protein